MYRQKATSTSTPNSLKPPPYLRNQQRTRRRPRQPSKICSTRYASSLHFRNKPINEPICQQTPPLARSPHHPTIPPSRLRIPPHDLRFKIQQPDPPPGNPPRPPPRTAPSQILHQRRPPTRQPPLQRPLRHLRLPELEPCGRRGRLHAR